MIVVIVVVVVLFVTLSAVLYGMTSGLHSSPNTASKPLVTFTVTKIAGGVDILVAGIQPTAVPSNFKVNLENASSGTFGTAVPMPTTSGTGVSVTVGTFPSWTVFSVTWQNPSGSGALSQGDHFVIVPTSGVYSVGTTFSFLLIWSDGSTLSTVTWQV